MIQRNRYLLWTAALLVAGCATDPEDGLLPETADAQLRFGASQCRVVTRSGDADERFADGTKYDLYALDASSSANWSTSGMAPALLSNVEGAENYAADEIVYGSTRVSYDGRTVDIYAATLGSGDNPGQGEGGVDYTAVSASSGPTYKLRASLEEASLPGIPDLMRAERKGVRGSEGKVTLEFRHALSKLTFEVVKQDESGDAAAQRKLDGIYVASIRLKGARTEGTLDLASDKWNGLQGGDMPTDEYRGFFTMGSSPWEIPHTTPQLLKTDNGKGGSATREIYIFPNVDSAGDYLAGERSRPLKVEVTLRKTSDASYEKTTTYTLHDVAADGTETTDAFRFKPNFEYRLTITVLRDDVRIVTVSPTVYDWIPAFTDGDMDVETLGRPITFGGLMWMDRNLGAETADCKSLDSWYKSIGYFYQHGRNIPYILDVERWLDKATFSDLAYYDNGTNNLSLNTKYAVMSMTLVKADGSESPAPFQSSKQIWPYGVATSTDPGIFYTYNYWGEKIYGAVKFNVSDTPALIPVRFPGQRPQQWSGGVLTDAIVANYDRAYRYAATYGNYLDSWYAPTTDINSNWANVDDQPCPAGWRLPTAEDLRTFMPYIDGKMIDWNTAVCTWGTVPTTTRYRPFLRFGWFEIQHEGKTMKVHRCRHIIDLGQSNASRIQIESRPVAGCTNKRYIHVARYPITDVNKDMYYYMDPDGDGVLDDALWQDEDIVEEMYFPASGGIVTDAGSNYPVWRWLGEGTVLRTSENNTAGNYATVCYIASSDLQLQIATTSRRVLACQIRCVKDVKR